MSEITLEEADAQSELDLPEGAHPISSHVTGTVWKLLVEERQHVEAGTSILIVESMKMEFAVEATVSGTIGRFFCKVGGHVSAGQLLLVIQED